jgi:transcription-repair coupling factor (superfamily II helicase)
LKKQRVKKVLISSLHPYFLEKYAFWFEENFKKIMNSLKTQSFFQDNLLYLEESFEYNLSKTLRKLDEMGYEKVIKVTEPGEFSKKGGLVEIFPVNSTFALRLDFYGNLLEEIEKLPVEIKDEKKTKEILKKKLKSQKVFSDLKGIKKGDYLVHLDHGVAEFKGFLSFSPVKGEEKKKYYVLEYDKGDKLYIPENLKGKLSRYVGFSEPKISRLSSSLWQRTKKKVKEETEKLAKELLEIYAKREISQRPPYSFDNQLEKEVSSNFPFQETPDQIQAIKDIEKDLKNKNPMDRLVCGDVGFGKTEIALRTAIKAVSSGYQAAMMCPTTILSEQHYKNFKERLKDLPIKVSVLNRMQPEKKQKEIKKELKEGKIDILIGTHRIISNDIKFKNLQLLIIDDEQKFGVKQKEKLKKIRSSLDVLSLSATPIPRTLYLSLSSLKKVSLIRTPPLNRIPIKTFVLPFSEKKIKEAIKKELKREGQVYYLHNRVETIESTKEFLESLNTKSKIGIIHGKMGKKKLSKTMEQFNQGNIKILIATTIIENGLDIPTVNTLIVDNASLLGLSQAYQIRGRVGRSHKQAFAYFFHNKKLPPKAKLRLKALKEEKELGSGYKIALRDLEIRGAGNILGKEQSGSINQVGLNLYCQILSQTIEKLKNSS